MSVVENSYYEHAEHGLVKVVSVDNGVVSFQKVNQEQNIPGMSRFPAGTQQSASGFLDCAEPADVTVPAQAAVFNLSGVDQ